jgi:hypothetical protein
MYKIEHLVRITNTEGRVITVTSNQWSAVRGALNIPDPKKIHMTKVIRAFTALNLVESLALVKAAMEANEQDKIFFGD